MPEIRSSLPVTGRIDDDRWAPDADALAVVINYLMDPPEQGEWAWADHVEGLAGGILFALHDAGIEVRR